MLEVRYHINPETGNPNKCRAKTPATCRFKPKDGEPPPHYNTAEEAREAYAETQKNSQGLQSLSKKAKTVSPAPLPPFSPEFERKLVEEADKVFSNFVTPDGMFEPPEEDSRWAPREFTFLGAGDYSNVYLNSDKTLVYKVPNDVSKKEHVEIYYSSDDPQESYEALLNYLKEETRDQQERYAQLSTSILQEEGLEYVPTYFIPVTDDFGGEYSIMAQPYLSPEEYAKADTQGLHYRDIKDLPPETWVKNGWGIHPAAERNYWKLGLRDLHTGNYRIRRRDHTIVFFDCI